MSEKIEPALTPEEWARLSAGEWVQDSETSYQINTGDVAVLEHGGSMAEIDSDDRHMAAAICLYGQPFGFTPTHVNALRQIVENECSAMLRPVLRDLTARVAALLPPDKSD